MENSFKRFLSLALAILMVFSNIPVSAFASEVAGCGHTQLNVTTTKAATCTEAGEMTFTCAVEGCGTSWTQAIDPSHHYVGGVCACGEVDPSYIAPMNDEEDIPESSETEAPETTSHQHSYESVVTAPTCTEAGYTTYTCSCEDTYVDNNVDALGHNYAEGVCTVCGAEAPAHEHSYEAVVTPPSCKPGFTTYTCACGDTYTADEVAATTHTLGEDGKCIGCGEKPMTSVAPVQVENPVAKIGETGYASLQEALNAAAAGSGEVTVEILDNINLTGVVWTPVTVSGPGYPVVTVNGNDKTITGLNDMLFAGTWAGNSGLIINDLTIANSVIVHDENDANGNVGVGAFVGFPQASETITLNNCHLVNSSVTGGHWTGGLIGYAAGYAGTDGPVFMNLTITNCSVTGSTISGKGSVGGIIGHGSGNAWTKVTITDTKVSDNTITSTGSSNNKAGAIMGTIGAAGQATEVNGVTKTGGAFVDAVVSGNTVTANGTAITTIYGRQGTNTGTVEITGGTYDNNPIEENVSYAYPKEGFVIAENNDSSFGIVEKTTEPETPAVVEVATYDELVAALANGGEIKLTADITATATQSSGYGMAGIVVDAGDVLDGNGHTLTINGANATWDCVIAMKGGVVKNLTIAGAMRGIFMPGANGDVLIDNCVFENVIYTFNSDAGSKEYTVTIKNTKLNGWTSFSDVHKAVVFDTCTFGKGSGYAYCRPYQATTFIGCEFNEGYEVDTTATAEETLAFNQCTYNGTAITAENGGELFSTGKVKIGDTSVDFTKYAAKIGEQGYEKLEAAFAAAVEGDTIVLGADATPVLKSQSAITKAAVIDLGGKTLTLTEDDLYFGTTTFKNGTIVVDPSVKPSTAVFWMFANQTLTFDNVKIVATGVTGTYLIGLDGDNSDLNLLNGSEIVVENTTALDLDIICVNASTGNDIVIDNSKVNVTNLDGRVLFRGNYTIKGTSELKLDGITKAGIRIEAGQTLSIEDTASVTITGEPRDGGIHLTDASATYTVAESATVEATVNAPQAAQIGNEIYMTLADAAAAAQAGDKIVLLADVTEDVTLPAGVIFNGNGKTVNGTVTAGGDLTFAGQTTVSTFSAGYYNHVITIGEGASLKVTSGRMTVSYGNVINITGSIENAKSADNAALTPSLELVGGISFTGNGGEVKFNVTNAYVKLGDSTTKNSAATGKFNVNFTNSIVDFTKTLKTYMPTASGLSPEFNFTAKDSVVNFASHLELWLDGTTMTLDNTNLTVGGSFANAGELNVTNGSNFVVKAPITSSHGGNTGTINVTGGKFELVDSSEDWQNAGAITVSGNGQLITNDYKNVGEGKLVLASATASIVGKADLGITTEIANATVKYDEATKTYVVELPDVAQVGTIKYKSIDDAIAAWTNNTTLTLLSDVTLSDVIQLSSTEMHTLDLGTYTMTAAKGKDAIQIVANGRSSASYALDIKADATNPGGITATGKAVVKTTGKSGVKDRPIIRFYNGVFTGTNVVYHSGSNGTNCPQFWFYGGEFNGTVYANRALFQFYGGTFNGSLQMSVDSSAYALIAGGTFKQLSNLYGSALNKDKFTIGSAKGVYDKEVYVDDNGYYVVAAAKPAEGIEAAVAKKPGTTDYLAYSKVATEGKLNYTDAETALKNNTSATVTVYADELDMSGINFKGTIVVPTENALTIKNAPKDLKVKDEAGNVLKPDANGTYVTPKGDNFNGYTGADGFWGEVRGNARESFVIKVLDANGDVMGTTSLNNIGGIIDGDVTVTWNLKLDAAANTDEYWTMNWTTAPSVDNMPAKVELWVDGVKVSGGNVVLNGPDDLNKIYYANVDAEGNILGYYTKLGDAITAVADGGIITLLSDVKIDKNSCYNLNGYNEGVYYEGDKSFTLDLNDKTLTQDGSVNDYLMLFKNSGTKASTITIKNGTVDAGTSAYCAICTSTTSTQKITINVENINIVGNNANGAVLKIRGGAELNVKAGTVITGKNNYVGIEAVGTDTVINIFEGAEIYQQGTGSYVGSLVGVSGNATANVKGGSGTSAQGCFIAMTSGGTINVEGGEWTANTNGAASNDNKGVLIAQSEKGNKSVVNVTGGTFKGGYNCYGNAVGDAQLNISGGIFNADPSAYVVEDYEAIELNDGTFEVKQKVHLIINVGSSVATMALKPEVINVATMDEAVAKANEIRAAAVTYKIHGPVELTTGGSHGILDLGKNVIIEGATKDAKLTIVGGGVPDIKGVTFKNLIIADEGTYLPTANEFMYQNFIDCSFDNVTFVDGIRLSGKSTLTNCTVDANTTNEYAIWLDEGEFTMTGTTVTGGENAYGLIKSDEVDKITISGNTFQYLGAANKEALNVKDATIAASKNTFIDCAKGILPADKTNYAADGTTVLTEAAIKAQNDVHIYVAQIGNVKYDSLAEALTAAKNGETVELIGKGTITMNGSVYGKSVTITGKATVDWSKGNLFIGRGGEGNGTVIFDNANLTSASNNATYGIHVSGREKNTTDKYDGTLVIKNSTIELDYLISKNIITLNKSTLTVKNGFSIGGRLADETESGVDATATLNLTDGSKLIVNNHNGMGLGAEGNKVGVGVMNIDKTSTFETTQSFLVTVKGTMNLAGTAKIAGTLTNNGAIVLTDAAATLTATECGNVTTNVADYKVIYAEGAYKLTPKVYVAQIGEAKFESLEEAFAAAQTGETITLLADVAPVLKSQSAITKASVIDLGGKTLTLTEDDLCFGTTTFKNGTIVVDPSVKPSTAVFWMLENQTLTFDAVKIVATGVTGTYLIGLDGNNSDLNLLNGSEIVVENDTALDLDIICVNVSTGNDIVIENSKVNVKNLDGRVFFRGNYTVSGNSDIDLSGITKAGFRIEAGQTLSIEDTAKVTITGEPRDGGIHLAAPTASYTKANTATVNATVVKEPFKVSTKAELNAALNAAQEGDTIILTADIDYGTDQLAITKAITLDLGGKTLTTRNGYGGMSIKGNPTVKNGTIVHASNTAAIKVWNATAFEDLVIDVQGKGDANKVIGGIVLQSGSTTRVGSIKNVTIKGAALTNGIETYNCGDATENVIGSMENVTIDAIGTGMLISAPCGTATNCSVKGGVNGIEIWIKGNYSASLDLVGSEVEGGVYAHDEHNTNPDIVNNGTLSLTVDEATTGVTTETVSLTINHAKEEQVTGEVLETIIDNAKAKVNGTYYATLAEAMKAAKDGDTVTIMPGTYDYSLNVNKSITVVGKGDVTLNGVPSIKGNGYKIENIDFVYGTGSTNLSGSGLIKDCSFTATDANGNTFRYCYGTKGGKITFEGCTLNAPKGWAVHFDSAPGMDLTFTNCEVNGRVALGGDLGSLTATGTTFKTGYVNVWGTEEGATFTECKFVNVPYIYTGDDADNVVNFNKCDDSVIGLIYGGNDSAAAKIYVDGVLMSGAAKIGNAYYQTVEEAFATAKNGDEVKILKAGTYKVPSGKNITVTGAVDGVVFDNIGAHNMGGASVTFNNVTFNYAANSTYKGLQHSGELVYNNCTFNGQVFLYGQSETFVGCTFENTGDNYNVWTYGAKTVEFNGCTFNSDGKSVLVYTEAAEHFIDVSVKESTFKASAAVEGKAAIEIDTSLTAGATITIDAATKAEGFANGNVSGNSLWNNKKGNNTDATNDLTVKVGDEIVLAPVTFAAYIGKTGYTTIGAAVKAAAAGDTVTVMAGSYIENLTINKAITVVGQIDEAATVSEETKPGVQHTNLVTINGKLNITATGAAVKNINVQNSGTACYVGAKDVLIENCSLTGSNGLYQSYTSGTVTFKDSTITGGTYGIHFDGNAGGNIVIDNCVVTGWTSFAKSINKVTIEDTTFAKGSQNKLRFYQDAELKNVTFNSEMSIDFGSKGTSASFVDCSVEGGALLTSVLYMPDINGMGINVTIDNNPVVVEATITTNGKTTYYASLAEALAAAKSGDTIVLDKDVTFSYGAREAYGAEDLKSLTIDGAGHVLTLNQTNSDWGSIGLKNADGKLVLKNMTIEKTGYGDTTGAWNTHAINFTTPVEMNKVTVNNAIAVGADAVLTNVTINEANGFYGLWIEANGQTVTVKDGSITAKNGGRGIKIADEYVNKPASVTLKVDGTKFTTAKKAAVLVSSTAGAEITANNVDISGVAADTDNFAWVDEDWSAHFNKVTVNKAPAAQESMDDMTAAFLDANSKVVSYFKTLQAAVDAAENGQTVTVIKDSALTETVTIPAGKTITLDLNGKTVSMETDKNTVSSLILNNGDLTVTDSSAKSGKLSYNYTGTNGSDAYNTIESAPGSKLTVKGGTIENLSANCLIAYAIDGLTNGNAGDVTVNIEGGVITSQRQSIRIFANSTTNTGTLNISGGEIIGRVIVQNANANANKAALNITGGTFKTNAYKTEVLYVDGSNGATIDMAPVVTGGTFYGEVISNLPAGFITGGTYKVAPADELLAPGYEIEYNKTTRMFGITTAMVASVNGKTYATLAEAVEAAKNGGTIYLTRDVVLNEAVAVPANAKFTLNMMTYTLNGSILAPNAEITIQDGSIVNKDKSVSAIEINAGKLTLTNVNVSSERHALRIDGAVTATVEGGKFEVIGTNKGTYHAVNVSGAANVTIKSGTFIGPKGTKADSGAVVNVQKNATVTIEGGTFSGGKNNTLASSGTLTVTGGTFDQDPTAFAHKDYKAVKNDAGKYEVVKKVYVVMISEAGYESFAEALNAVKNGETITILDGAKGSEIKTEIEFTKDIEFTITGKAPKYELPVITFQNATVNIKDAEILIPELDARKNATINVIDSIVHDAGGNSIVKSYYNGKINISGNSEVYTMQVTTMGYITVTGAAKLNATWQTNVYGNGMITVEKGAAFATAAMHVTGQDYSDRDNTDADRVGKPAAIVVDNAKLIVGKVYSDNGADYSYNSSKGINIGTVDGKSAVLDIKNNASVEIYMADGQTANIGEGGTVNVDGTVIVACRAETGAATLVNNGSIVLKDTDAVLNANDCGKVTTDVKDYDVSYEGGAYKLTAKKYVAQIGDEKFESLSEALTAAKNGETINLIWSEGNAPISMKGSVFGKSVTITGKATVDWSKGNLFIGRGGKGDATVIFKNAELTSASNSASYGIHVSGREKNTDNKFDGTLVINNSSIELDYLINKGEMNLNNSTLTVKNGFSIGGRPASETESGKDATATLSLTNGSKVVVNNHNGMGLGHEAIGVMNIDKTSSFETTQSFKVTAKGTMNIAGTAKIAGTLTNNGSIVLTDAEAKLTASECGNVTTNVADHKWVYENGVYKVVAKAYVAQVGNQKFESLQAAIDACVEGNNTITLLADSAEDITVKQTEGVNITIDGNGKTYSGTITIHGNARYEGKETLTIKNFKFVTDEAGHYFIDSNSTGSVERYAHNVTVTGSTFTATGAAVDSAAAMRIRQGFDIEIKNVKTTDMHSLLQAYGNDGITITGVTVNGKNGIAVGTSKNVVITNTNITATGYGIRADGATDGNMTIKNVTVTANDPIVVRKYEEAGYQLTLEGTNDLTGKNANGYQVIFTAEDDGTYVAPTAAVKVSGAEKLNVFPVHVVKIGDALYASLKDAITAAKAGNTITFLADINENVVVNKNVTIDGAEFKYTGEIKMDAGKTVTVKNVNFVKGWIETTKSTKNKLTVENCDFDGVDNTINYAVTMRGGSSVTIKNCTAKHYLLDMLWVPNSVANVTVKDTEVTECRIAVNVAYGTNITLEGVKTSAVEYGIQTHNYGAKTITIRNCDLEGDYSVHVYDRENGNHTTDTFIFEGKNIIRTLPTEYAKLVLNPVKDGKVVDAKLITPENVNVNITTTTDGYKVVYDTAAYKLVEKDYVAQIGEGETAKKFETLAEAFDKAQDGDTIIMIDDHVMDGSKPVKDTTYRYDNLIVNGKEITLDFAGYTVEVTPDFTATDDGGLKSTVEAVIFLENGASLTMLDDTGKGGFNVKEGTDLYSLIYNCGSTLNIKSGNYNVAKTVTAGSLIYADKPDVQKTTIEGGVFTLGNAGQDTNSTKPWLFNVEGKNNGFVHITGGYFNQNPHLNLGTAKDCEVTVDEGVFFQQITSGEYAGYWTIEDAVAKRVDAEKNTILSYNNLADAVKDFKEGETIVLLQNVAEVTIDGNVTIDLNGKTISTITLAAETATLTAAENLNVVTNIEGHKVVFVDGTYKVAPIVYVAQVGEAKYESLNDAIVAAKDGDTVKVIADHQLDENDAINVNEKSEALVYINKSITIDLNGNNLTAEVPEPIKYVFYCAEGAEVEITGTGSVDATGEGLYYMFNNAGKMTISDGNYTFKGITQGGMFYAINSGMSVTGGKFTQNNKGWMFNTVGNGVGNIITVSGGTFNRYFIGGAEWDENTWGEVVLADGLTLVEAETEGYWTIAKAVAKRVGADGADIKIYSTLAEALADVQNGETVVLMQDCAEDVTIKQVAGLSFTIDGNDNTYTGTISINGNKRSTGAETLTFQNINFVVEKGIFAERDTYAHNIIVDGCTFTGVDNVEYTYGIHLRGAYNVTVKNTTATKLLDLIYAQNFVDNLVVENVKVSHSTNGVWAPYGMDATFTNVDMNVSQHGVYIGNRNACEVTFDNVTIKSETPIVLEQQDEVTKAVTLTFSGVNQFISTNDKAIWLAVVGTDATFKAVIEDAGLDMKKTSGLTVKVGENVYYNTLANAIKAKVTEDVTVLKDNELSSDWTAVQNVTVDKDATLTVKSGVTLTTSKSVIVNGTLTDEDATYVLTAAEATIKAQEDLNVITTVEKASVVYEDGIHKLQVPVAKIVGTETYFDTVAEALAAAKSGETVIMLANSEEGTVLMNTGAKLDLNGHELKLAYIIAFNDNFIVDTSAENSGVIKVAKNSAIFAANNTELALYNGEGYIFTTVSFLQMNDNVTPNSVRFRFRPGFESHAQALLLDNGGEDNLVSMIVRVDWEGEDEKPVTVDFKFLDSDLQGIASGKGVMNFSVSGLEQIGVVNLTAVLVSDTGIEVCGKTLTSDHVGQ